MKKQSGFTIIELIVVIAIIAVLAGIVLTNTTKYQASSKNAAIKADIDQFFKQELIYFSNNAHYGSTSDDTKLGQIYTKVDELNGDTSVGPALGFSTACDGNKTGCYFCTGLVSSNNSYCEDTSGYKKETTTACTFRFDTNSYLCKD